MPRARVCLIGLVTLAACDRGIPLLERPRPASAHARYADGLERAGLATTALGRGWLAAADSAIRAPTTVTLPFRQVGYFSDAEARASAFAVRLRDGQRISATTEVSGTPLTIFLDLFLQTGDSARPLELVASPDTASGISGTRLVYEPRRDGVYVLRVQPELLRSGAFTLTIVAEPSLAFPVEGRDSRAIQSFFGADRDAGARQHHGIDIFAPRGTPVLAAARGVVRSISPNNLGGNVVWLSDLDHGQTLYYAHLDRHNVTAGQAVRTGDTLGFVGNTGNARTTPPHLHFGVYRRGQGPRDPYPFVFRPSTRPARVEADTGALGELVRSRSRVTVLDAPAPRAAAVRTVDASTPLTIDAATGTWYAVRLPDGAAGYVPSRLVESARRPVTSRSIAPGSPLRDRPTPTAAIVSTAPGGAMPVLGSFDDYALVETTSGTTAWVASGRLK